MARRRRNGSEGGVSLDSLMDAMTNVVAVLILVLVLVQADVSQTVQRFIDDLKPATPEEVEQARQRVVSLKDKRQNRLEILEAAAPDPRAIEQEKRELALLEKEVGDNRKLLADRQQVVKLEQKLRQDRNAEKQKTDKLQEQIAKLEAMLDATPVKVSKPDVVTIPASRPIPEGAKIYYAYVFDGRVHLIDPFTPLDLFEREFRMEKNDWEVQRIKRPGADVYRYSAGRIMNHFKGFDWGNRRGQKVELVSQPHWGHLRIRITPNASSGGTTTEELADRNSPFHQAVKSLARVRNAVLMFRVHPNSFDTYLAARPLADIVNLPAGWEAWWGKTYEFVIPDLSIKPTAKPPEPAGGPPKGPQPPKLDPTLD
ncbi:hypothetical protein [Haloferula sp. A504]|uniref:hypothetical protein n=1 Tax=Haloferula sp. A504 TaxID=3373601 RepID=UPI0031CB397B|nr:hypothetical protein [Verrucomicrobiaceae bacterium E54]